MLFIDDRKTQIFELNCILDYGVRADHHLNFARADRVVNFAFLGCLHTAG